MVDPGAGQDRENGRKLIVKNPLINQPSLRPTRKVSAAIVAGILTNAVIALANAWIPEVGTALEPQITAGVTAVVMGAAAYLVRERG